MKKKLILIFCFLTILPIFKTTIIFAQQKNSDTQTELEYKGIIYGTDQTAPDKTIKPIELEQKKINLIDTSAELKNIIPAAVFTDTQGVSIKKSDDAQDYPKKAFTENYSVKEEIKTDKISEMKPQIKTKKNYTFFYILGGLALLLIAL
ncbi:MAG TPA: hypothetical protein PLM75_01230 [bacterium]|nr:hypothetical protein [bacterium]